MEIYTVQRTGHELEERDFDECTHYCRKEVVNMTKNQIDYQTLKETKRNNAAVLEETAKHNRASEAYNLANLQETGRHNVAQEGETSRHNQAVEAVDLAQLQETSQHNRATEEQEKQKLAETIRANQAKELQLANELSVRVQELNEAVRSHVSNERLTHQANIIRDVANSIQQEANEQTAKLRFLEQQTDSESVRSQNAKNLAQIDQIKSNIQVAQRELDLAVKAQNWKQVNDVATVLSGLIRTYSQTK